MEYYKKDYKDHARACAYAIKNHILNGEGKHINVFLSKNIDKDALVNCLYRVFEEREVRIHILGREKGYEQEVNNQEQDEIDRFFKWREFPWEKRDIVVLLDMNAAERKRIGKYMDGNTDTVVVSINTPALSAETDKELRAMGIDTSCVNVKESVRYTNNRVALALAFVEEQYLIYELDTIFDIRDIGIAKAAEQRKIKKQLKEDLANFIAQFKTLSKGLQRPRTEFIPGSKPSMGLLSIADAQRNCVMLWELVQFLQQILDSVGIDNEAIMKEFLQIQLIKSENEAGLLSDDEDTRKTARKTIVDAIAEATNRLTRNTITVAVYDEIETEITEILTPEVWNKLTKESRRYLISAIASYRMLERYQAKNKNKEIDFSGVCILMAKAVEREMFLRVFKGYKEFVYYNKYQDKYERWPSGIRNGWRLDDGGYRNIPKSDNDFTLGTIPFIVGEKGKDTATKDYNARHFKEFASDVLYGSCYSDYEIVDNISALNDMMVEINTKYRNNAAHKYPLDYETATSCKDYIIYVEKALKETLGKMQY